MPGPIHNLARRYLRNPEWIRTGGEAEPVEQVAQGYYYEVATEDRTPPAVRASGRGWTGYAGPHLPAHQDRRRPAGCPSYGADAWKPKPSMEI